MIFKQFIVLVCCEMLAIGRWRFVILTVLFILPLISSSETVRKRRRPTLEQSDQNNNTPFPDQVAQPANFDLKQYPSIQFLVNDGSVADNSRQDSLINLLDGNPQSHPKNYDETTLADAKTAEEYVHKALKLQGGGRESHSIPEHQNTIGTTSRYGSDYEVYESEQTSQSEIPFVLLEKKAEQKSKYDPYDYREQVTVTRPIQDLYKGYHPTDNYGNFQQSTERIQNYNRVPNEPLPNNPHRVDEYPLRNIPKEEIMKYIEDSVNKYMKALEAKGNHSPRDNNKNLHHLRAFPKNHKPLKTNPAPYRKPVENIFDYLDENVEFVYKSKSQPPIPQKVISPNFDHLRSHPEFDHAFPYERPSLKKKQLPLTNVETDQNRPYRDSYFEAKPSNVHSGKFYRDKKPSLPGRNINDNNYNPYPIVAQKQSSESGWHPITAATSSVIDSENNYPGGFDDSYSPKYNNNPNGYGYQHNYNNKQTSSSGGIQIQSADHHSAKRHIKPKKRIVVKHIKSAKIPGYNANTDSEASVALRPPPPHHQKFD